MNMGNQDKDHLIDNKQTQVIRNILQENESGGNILQMEDKVYAFIYFNIY